MPPSARLLVALGLVACTSRADLPAGPPDAGEVTFEIAPTDRLDLLLMVDNSVAQIGQQEFGAGLPLLLARLGAVPGGTPDLHVAVISSDLGAGSTPIGVDGPCARVGGDRGVFHTRPTCGLPPQELFLKIPRGGAASSTVPVAEALACMAQTGLRGCGYEHQLASVTKALDAMATPENAGFLRPDAHLAIVLLTDEDDCSAPPDSALFSSDPDQNASVLCAVAGHVCNGVHPAAAELDLPMAACAAAEDGPLIPVRALVDRVRASKVDPDRQLTVAALFAVPAAHPDVRYRIVGGSAGLRFASECHSLLGTAVLGLRLPKFVEAFGAAGSSHDICVDDLAPTMTRIGETIAGRLTSACAPIGIAGCQVTAGTGALEACLPGSPRPCWRLESDARCSSAARLVIEGAGALPAGTRITARCRPQ